MDMKTLYMTSGSELKALKDWTEEELRKALRETTINEDLDLIILELYRRKNALHQTPTKRDNT